jgi:hypothetical protein
MDFNIPAFRHCLLSVARQWSFTIRCLAMDILSVTIFWPVILPVFFKYVSCVSVSRHGKYLLCMQLSGVVIISLASSLNFYLSDELSLAVFFMCILIYATFLFLSSCVLLFYIFHVLHTRYKLTIECT